MPYCTFTIDEIEFGYSYGDGLIIPNTHLNPDYLFNLEFNRTLLGAFQISDGLEVLLYISQYDYIPNDKSKLEKLVKLNESFVRFGAQFTDPRLANLLDAASKEASQRLLLQDIAPVESHSRYE